MLLEVNLLLLRSLWRGWTPGPAVRDSGCRWLWSLMPMLRLAPPQCRGTNLPFGI